MRRREFRFQDFPIQNPIHKKNQNCPDALSRDIGCGIKAANVVNDKVLSWASTTR